MNSIETIEHEYFKIMCGCTMCCTYFKFKIVLFIVCSMYFIFIRGILVSFFFGSFKWSFMKVKTFEVANNTKKIMH